MFYDSEGIILNYIPYNDQYQICRILTENDGLASFLVKKTKNKKIASHLYPLLSFVRCNFTKKNNQSMGRINEMKLNFAYSNLHTDPFKVSISFFLSELLYTCVKEELADASMYYFTKECLQYLDEQPNEYANFYLWFSLHLSSYLGFNTDISSYKEGFYWNLAEGNFVANPTHYYCEKKESFLIHQLASMPITSYHTLKLNYIQRQVLLETILQYYELHHYSCKHIKSIKILQEIFRAF